MNELQAADSAAVSVKDSAALIDCRWEQFSLKYGIKEGFFLSFHIVFSASCPLEHIL